MASINNVIFDMDGVLVNSEPVIEAADIQGLKEYGVEAKPEDFKPFIGAGEDRYIGGVAEKYGVEYKKEMKDRVYEIYLDIVSDKIKVFDGTKETLNKLNKADYNLALASSADRIKIDANLREAGFSPSLFEVIISGEEVSNKKPSPDIYKKTANKMKVLPEKCVVIEDSINGVKSAKAAGMKCIALTTSFSKEKLKKANPDFICDHIEKIYTYLKS